MLVITGSFLGSACSGPVAGDTYIRFTIEGRSYETADATFSVSDLNREAWKFVEIARDVTRRDAFDPPAASLQWRMALQDPTTLEGRTIEIRNLDDREMADPLIHFVLADDVTVANMSSTDASVTIARISGGVVEGTFRGDGLDYLADGQQRTVDVTGTFRARWID